jgi:hypothetical protein
VGNPTLGIDDSETVGQPANSKTLAGFGWRQAKLVL